MAGLPVIVGFGGYNAAGRSAGHHAFRRMALETLPAQERQETLAGLAVLMQLVEVVAGQYQTKSGEVLSLVELEQRFGEQICAGTLVRRIESNYLNVDAAPWQKNLNLTGAAGKPLTFMTLRKQLPEPLPSDWVVESLNETDVLVTLYDGCDIKIDSFRELSVKSAGQLPSGFRPDQLYPARFHPRGLQMAIVAASDALHSMGIAWSRITQVVPPEQIAVYASSVMSQMDEYGLGGLLQARLKGNRVTSKQVALGLNSMVTDFINAYVIGSVGSTGTITGACASFLYNLQKGIEQISSGQARVVIVGNSEAPITQEIIDGYAAMGALATAEGVRQAQGLAEADLRRTSMPFGQNCGFTLAESAQFVVLMDDALAMELGADLHGAVTDVFINADGFKKSISAPGPGNYLTMARAVASAIQIAGAESVRKHSFVQAHGSSTPVNRVTESHLLDQIAATFGIAQWPVTAVKAYLGHSLATASADQLMSALGSFRYQLIAGIKTIDAVAEDVARTHLQIVTHDTPRSAAPLEVCFINSKGFGGNNATAVLLAPHIVERMLSKRYGAEAFAAYCARREQTRTAAAAYDQAARHGQFDILYNFGNDQIEEQSLKISPEGVGVPGFAKPLVFPKDSRFSDMLD